MCDCDRSDGTVTAAAMCALCRHGGPHAERCRVDEAAVIVRINSRSCPLGRHPDNDGLVRWAGLRWRGVPYPLRRRAARFTRTGRLPGCGCLDAPKRIVENLWRKVAACIRRPGRVD